MFIVVRKNGNYRLKTYQVHIPFVQKNRSRHKGLSIDWKQKIQGWKINLRAAFIHMSTANSERRHYWDLACRSLVSEISHSRNQEMLRCDSGAGCCATPHELSLFYCFITSWGGGDLKLILAGMLPGKSAFLLLQASGSHPSIATS